VADEAAVQELARRAVERFGRIDVWVNNAGVIAYGLFEDTPSDVFRRVVEISLFGEVHGARAALTQFRGQPGGGVLVNVASLWGRVTSPYVAPYVVSKFGIRALSECLRQGLKDLQGSEDIHICTILPESIDTPIFRHGANYTGRPVRPVPPIADPARVAKAIVRCARRPRHEVTVGWTGHALDWWYAVTPPRLVNRVMPRAFDVSVFGPGSAEPAPGNLFAPMPELNGVDGGWRRTPEARVRRRAVAGALALAPLIGAGVAGRRLAKR
jgi:NAD(P)-dependent dehydrogenase (short-subunit alcohol dehydrogenase family)